MSLPYYPFYPSDFEAKTSHLTLEEDGAYNRLLRLIWMTPGCSIPDDPAWIARRLRVDRETFDRVVAPIIAEFFRKARKRIYSPRLSREFESAKVTHELRVSSGKKGGRPRKPLENNTADESRAKAGPKQPEPEPEPVKETEANASEKKSPRGSRLPADWRLPKAWGEWAVSEGMAEPAVRRQAERFRDYWVGKAGKDAAKLDWEATWRNWVRKHLDESRTGARPSDDQFGAFGKIRSVG
jgi:uncharacterized protein YdaU (DUF1376 family)